jgi:hypothetical protein
MNEVSLNLADVNKKLKWLDTFMYSSPVSDLIKVRSGVLEMLRDHRRTDGRFEQLRRDAGASSKYTDITSSPFIGTGFAINSSDLSYPGSILGKHFLKE